jgi:hypothetical protein
LFHHPLRRRRPFKTPRRVASRIEAPSMESERRLP